MIELVWSPLCRLFCTYNINKIVEEQSDKYCDAVTHLDKELTNQKNIVEIVVEAPTLCIHSLSQIDKYP